MRGNLGVGEGRKRGWGGEEKDEGEEEGDGEKE